MKRLGDIVLGCILIIVGIIVGLNLFNITNIDLFFDGWWTLLIIIPSKVVIIAGKHKVDGIVGLVVGVILLLVCQNVVSEETVIKIAIPLIIVALGVCILIKSLTPDKNDTK